MFGVVESVRPSSAPTTSMSQSVVADAADAPDAVDGDVEYAPVDFDTSLPTAAWTAASAKP